MGFQVGDEVVCVDAADVRAELTQGAVYVVERVVTLTHMGTGKRARGIIPRGVLSPRGRPCAFLASRFRKVQKKLTGMETLRGLLKGTPAKVSVDA